MASIIQKKRLANEVKLLANQPLHYCTAYPDETNPLIWYFLIKGQKNTDYHNGEYIGKIVHSPKYPAEPPDYYMMTPSGRYNVGTKICLTNSSYHRGDWSSTWNIQSILIAFYSIWLDDKEHGISHIVDSSENRKRMATESIAYNLKNNKDIYDKFDRTHLRDDDPVVLKEKVVNDEEQTSQGEKAEQPLQGEKAEQPLQGEKAEQPLQGEDVPVGQVEQVMNVVKKIFKTKKKIEVEINNEDNIPVKDKKVRKTKVMK